MCSCVYTCVWRPAVNFGYRRQSLFTLLFETVSQWPEVHKLGEVVWPGSSGTILHLPPRCCYHRNAALCPNSHVGAEDSHSSPHACVPSTLPTGPLLQPIEHSHPFVERSCTLGLHTIAPSQPHPQSSFIYFLSLRISGCFILTISSFISSQMWPFVSGSVHIAYDIDKTQAYSSTSAFFPPAKWYSARWMDPILFAHESGDGGWKVLYKRCAALSWVDVKKHLFTQKSHWQTKERLLPKSSLVNQ